VKGVSYIPESYQRLKANFRGGTRAAASSQVIGRFSKVRKYLPTLFRHSISSLSGNRVSNSSTPTPQHFAKQSIYPYILLRFQNLFKKFGMEISFNFLKYPLISSRGGRHRVLKRIQCFSSIFIHTRRLKSSLMRPRALEEITCQFYVTLFLRIIGSKNEGSTNYTIHFWI
jgi:hypothetical protein